MGRIDVAVSTNGLLVSADTAEIFLYDAEVSGDVWDEKLAPYAVTCPVVIPEEEEYTEAEQGWFQLRFLERAVMMFSVSCRVNTSPGARCSGLRQCGRS